MSTKKRILIFSTAYLPFVGGAEVAVKEITERLSAQGGSASGGGDYEFVMITARLRPDLLEEEKVGNIEVHRLGKGSHWDKYRLVWQGARYASKLGHFDAVWSIMASYAGFAALRFKKHNLSVPWLLTLQEGDSRWQIYKHVWWCWPWFKLIFRQADRIQAISNYLAEWAGKMGARGSVEVVPNGVDVEKSQIANRKLQINNKFQITNIKRQLGIDENGKIVITVSRLVKKNGVSDLIKAVKFLDANVHLLVVGDGELKNQLVLLANQLELISRIHFIGYLNHEELLPYLWASNVFCRPSLSEGLGNVFLEAMAAGVPVIGTRVGGIPDFLRDGKTGWFCETRNPESIAEKIKYILNEKNKEEVLKVTENGRKVVEEKYGWDLIAKKMEGFLLLSNKS